MERFPELSETQLARLDVAGPRYTSYPTVPEWSADFGAAAYTEALEAASAQPELPLSVYVHIPFCEERCTFCGCNVVVTKKADRAEEYLDYVERELKLVAERLGARRKLGQLHYGGGTPTFLSEDQLQRLWDILTAHFTPTEDAAIAIEVDPVVTRPSQLKLLAQLGFNRISMGVQDFDPVVQEAIHREQTVEETAALVDCARAEGFSGVNFDLIYGLPGQNTDRWSETLEKVLALDPDRLAVYSFAYLPDVRRNQRVLPMANIPTGRVKLNLLRDAYNAFVGAGYRAIGMDHFAKAEDELSIAQGERRLHRNFQGYTARTAEDTIALGMTGIGDLQGRYAQSLPQLNRYLEALDAGQLPVARGFSLSEEDLRRRQLITQLMCNFYVELDDPAHWAPELEALEELSDLIRFDGAALECTPLGRIFVRNVAMVFDTYLKKSAHRFSRTV